jgi:ABC-type Fe3+ transport system permease subunit
LARAPRLADLGKWTSPAFYVLALVLATLTIIPLSLVVLASLGPFTAAGWSLTAWTSVFNNAETMAAVQTSFSIAIGASFLSILFFSAIAYFATRAKARVRGPLDLFVGLPGFVPSVIFAMGIFVATAQIPQLGEMLYGKVVVLVMVALLTTLPIGVQVMRGALATLGTDVVDASTAAGAGLAYTLRHVLLPLIAPAMLLVGMLTFALAIRMTGPMAILATDTSKPLTVLQLEMVRAGADPAASVIGVLVSVAAVGVAVGARLISIGGASSLDGREER